MCCNTKSKRWRKTDTHKQVYNDAHPHPATHVYECMYAHTHTHTHTHYQKFILLKVSKVMKVTLTLPVNSKRI